MRRNNTVIRKIDSIEVIESIKSFYLDGGKIVLYGAGRYGELFKEYLRRVKDVEIDSFAISKGENLRPNEIPVKYIDDITVDSLIVICISEQRQSALIDNARRLGFSNVFVILNDFIRYIESQLYENRLDVKEELSFEVHITEHCNLNCKGCYHFSPLSGPDFLSVEEYGKDLERLATLSGGRAGRITLLGGEPLLHPNICSFIELSRSYFTNCKLELLTNGVLLLNMNEDFWECCKNNQLELYCTKYPVPVDYERVEEKAAEYGLKVGYHNDVLAGEKTLIKYPFDLSGKQDPKWNFEQCTRSNLCTTLKHGRIYPCPMAAHAHLAKEYFNLNVELSDDDSIDIYKANDIKEIMLFLTKPIPFCRYCNLKRRPEQTKWEQSNKAFSEWF